MVSAKEAEELGHWAGSRRLLGKSIPPKVPKPVGRKLGVPNGVLDVLMPEVVLQGARVVAIVGKLALAGMAEHVRMHTERHLGSLPEPRNHSAETDRAHGRSPLSHEDVAAWRLLALKPAQRAKFAAGQWVNRGNAVLEPRDVQPGMHEIDLLPAQGRQLRRS